MKRKPIIVVAGKMGAGKDTVLEEMKNQGFKRLVCYTTRKMRPKEIDGVNYHYVSDSDFKHKLECGFFAESREYSTADGKKFYGTSAEDLISGKYDFVELSLDAIINVRNQGIDLIVIYLDCPDEVRKDRALRRSDDVAEVERRLNDETLEFDARVIDMVSDYKVNSNRSLEHTVAEIIEIYNNLENEGNI